MKNLIKIEYVYFSDETGHCACLNLYAESGYTDIS